MFTTVLNLVISPKESGLDRRRPEVRAYMHWFYSIGIEVDNVDKRMNDIEYIMKHIGVEFENAVALSEDMPFGFTAKLDPRSFAAGYLLTTGIHDKEKAARKLGLLRDE